MPALCPLSLNKPGGKMDFSVVPSHFKFALPFLAAGFIASFAVFPFYIKKLKQLQWGQQIREEGPKDHLSKKGTPTMGGLVTVLMFIIFSAALWGISENVKDFPFHITTDYWVFAGIFVLNALLGFSDDFLKIKKSKSLGLRAREKMAAHIIMGIGLWAYMAFFAQQGTKVFIPFAGEVDFGWWLLPFCLLVLPGSSNAVNLTDGLDGLAASNVTISLIAFSLILIYLGRFDMFTGCLFLIGGLLAFLWFNCYPARVFMGDTGSLALGGALAAIAILTGTEIVLCVIGGVYVCEALSVMIQVAYFKKTGGKRFFKMAPIHHHFEKEGYHETQVTVRFAMLSLALALTGLLMYFGI